MLSETTREAATSWAPKHMDEHGAAHGFYEGHVCKLTEVKLRIASSLVDYFKMTNAEIESMGMTRAIEMALARDASKLIKMNGSEELLDFITVIKAYRNLVRHGTLLGEL